MKAITREWLQRASDDLAAAKLLLHQQELTNIVAFHAQQVVEKTLKAAFEELDLAPIRTHSLIQLYEKIKAAYPLVSDIDMLDRLEAVYIETRYPTELGLLPYGKPTPEAAAAFCEFAEEVFQRFESRFATCSPQEGE